MFTIKIRPVENLKGGTTGQYRWFIFDTGFPVNESNNWPIEGGEADSLPEAIGNAAAALLKRFA